MKRMHLIRAALPVVVLMAAVRCGTVTAVTPLHRGESALTASVGGPVASIAGMNIPMPYAVARYRYGLKMERRPDRSWLHMFALQTSHRQKPVGGFSFTPCPPIPP